MSNINFSTWEPHHPETWTHPYALLRVDLITRDGQKIFAGTPVRIVMVSRMGDVGITRNLNTTQFYETRVDHTELMHYSATREELQRAIFKEPNP